ncbi:hypothetical protein N7456_010469 [Penicillium angulare]|uniref:mRNA stability protein n=1 Tax=Penicillium angulare TaxID=116970 RepID=A0A9W9F6P0_9EURO|nr:hypothetical protein N7456_010469 [Penicillium angulare]
MQPGGNESYAEPLSESEKRHFSKYGKVPRGGAFGQKPKGRTYFDSGDFALAAAHRVTDNGAIQTGSAHPHRESISHPFAPIPAASNVDKDANEDLHRKSESPEKSPLLQHTNMEDERPVSEEEKYNHISH